MILVTVMKQSHVIPIKGNETHGTIDVYKQAIITGSKNKGDIIWAVPPEHPALGNRLPGANKHS